MPSAVTLPDRYDVPAIRIGPSAIFVAIAGPASSGVATVPASTVLFGVPAGARALAGTARGGREPGAAGASVAVVLPRGGRRGAETGSDGLARHGQRGHGGVL